MPKRSPGSRSAHDINRQFGSRLRTFREMAGRSQTEVGQALRVSFQQIQKYENGTTSINLDRLDELARYFASTVPKLVDGLGLYQSQGFAESDQSPYGVEPDDQPGVGPLSRDAVALINAFNAIRSRKLRRAILTLMESYGNGKDDSEGEDEASPS